MDFNHSKVRMINIKLGKKLQIWGIKCCNLHYLGIKGMDNLKNLKEDSIGLLKRFELALAFLDDDDIGKIEAYGSTQNIENHKPGV